MWEKVPPIGVKHLGQNVEQLNQYENLSLT